MTEAATTFIVAHRLSIIKEADRIIVIEKGRIIETGTYEELMTNKGYFYQIQHE
ncbi:hypothetical protein P7H50_06000 [Enterococcus durans]|nr:hypothetical protein [Enterococcus durans]